MQVVHVRALLPQQWLMRCAVCATSRRLQQADKHPWTWQELAALPSYPELSCQWTSVGTKTLLRCFGNSKTTCVQSKHCSITPKGV